MHQFDPRRPLGSRDWRCYGRVEQRASGVDVLILSDRWALILNNKGETGMGYQVVTVHLRDGRKFDGVVVIDSAIVTLNANSADVPFVEDEIADIVLTHDKRAAGLIS